MNKANLKTKEFDYERKGQEALSPPRHP